MSNSWKFIIYHEKFLSTTTLQVQPRQVQCVSFSDSFTFIVFYIDPSELPSTLTPTSAAMCACGRDKEAKG